MNQVLVEISARHIHLNEADLETLFGKGHTLTRKKDLSQPGQYACEERVDIIGPKRELKSVSVLGPTRSATQVEISLTDARSIGAIAPIRESGVLDGSPGCKLVGPVGEVEIPAGLIAAKRHIHLDPETAARFGLTDQQNVKVRLNTDGRALIFEDVVVRVHPSYAPAMHIDTDEGNAAGIQGEVYGEILTD